MTEASHNASLVLWLIMDGLLGCCRRIESLRIGIRSGLDSFLRLTFEPFSAKKCDSVRYDWAGWHCGWGSRNAAQVWMLSVNCL